MQIFMGENVGQTEQIEKTDSKENKGNQQSPKIALVTGASRGIGRAILQNLGQTGLTVIGSATTDTGAAAITEFCQAQGFKGQGVCLNIADPNSIAAVYEIISAQYGAPSILVNNAGITLDNLLLRMKDEEWVNVINTNLNGVFRLTQICIRAMMKARWGRIVNISSVVGSTGNAGQANYAAAKAGLIGFTKSIAKELGSRGITANVIAPGFIDTDMTRVLPDDIRKQLLAQIPLGRIGSAEEIADAVQFLVLKAGYITGETLHVNGGMYMG